MLIFRRLLVLHPILALAAIVMSVNAPPAQGQQEPLLIPAGTPIPKGKVYSSSLGTHSFVLGDDGNIVVSNKNGTKVYSFLTPEVLGTVGPRVDHMVLNKDGEHRGFIGLFDVKGTEILRGGGGKEDNAMLTLTNYGALQVVAGDVTLWSSDRNNDPPIKVFLVKADIKEDQSQLTSEKGWDKCYTMGDPAIKIFATNKVSYSAINGVANIYQQMALSLNPEFPRHEFDGFKVYITNGESVDDLKKLNTVGTMWNDGTGPGTRDELRGGACGSFVWISEQMICKTGVATRGERDKDTRTFDQVVHEFAHSIDAKFIGGRGNSAMLETNFDVKDGKKGVEGWAWGVQNWFRAPDWKLNFGAEFPQNRVDQLGKIFLARPWFSTEGYGATPNIERPSIVPQAAPLASKVVQQTASLPVCLDLASAAGRETAQRSMGIAVFTPPQPATQTKTIHTQGSVKRNLFVTNKTGQTLVLFWVNGDGTELKTPTTVAPAANNFLIGDSYPGHLFRFKIGDQLVHSWVIQEGQPSLTIY